MISFIVPVYNAEKYIKPCLESVCRQTASFPYEVIVVDDGSKDGTKAVVTALAEKDSHIQYFYKENGGVSSARNFGLQMCKGEFVAFLDADDYLADNCLECLSGYEAFDLTVYGYYYKTSKHMFPVLNKEKQERYDDVAKGFMDLYQSNLFNSVWNKVYKKEYIKTLFDETLVMGEDLIFNINYFKHVSNVKVVNEPLYYYYVNDGSVTQKYHEKYIHNFIRTREALIALKEYFKISSFPSIEINFLENVVGTIRLLVYNKSYQYSMQEMRSIYNALEGISITEHSKDRFTNMMYSLFQRKMFTSVYAMMHLKRIVKKICQRR